jgi:pimeloyl-ACP methyl ester carboxylesterase
VTGWQLGLNTGPTQDVVRRLPARLQAVTDAAGAPATVIGWSLGGIYARALAVRSPELVRQVITLGSPYATHEPGQTHADAAYRLLSRRRFREATSDRPDPSAALSMPTTSIYSRLDGIVSWRICREDAAERRESIAVPASHLGLGHHPAVLWVVADRLAQDPNDWRPFVPPRGMAAVFTVDRSA